MSERRRSIHTKIVALATAAAIVPIPMQYVPFGKTGLYISEISLGGMQINCEPGFKGANRV